MIRILNPIQTRNQIQIRIESGFWEIRENPGHLADSAHTGMDQTAAFGWLGPQLFPLRDLQLEFPDFDQELDHENGIEYKEFLLI